MCIRDRCVALHAVARWDKILHDPTLTSTLGAPHAQIAGCEHSVWLRWICMHYCRYFGVRISRTSSLIRSLTVKWRRTKRCWLTSPPDESCHTQQSDWWLITVAVCGTLPTKCGRIRHRHSLSLFVDRSLRSDNVWKQYALVHWLIGRRPTAHCAGIRLKTFWSIAIFLADTRRSQ